MLEVFPGFWDCFCGILVGLGVGAYNSHHMKDCLTDTFHLGKQKAKAGAEEAARKSKPYMDKAGEHMSNLKKQAPEMARKFSDKASEHMTNLKQQSQEQIDKAK